MELNYWEHFKYAKDLALVFQPTHPKRVKIEETLNSLITQINNIKSNHHAKTNKKRSDYKN